MDAASAAAIVSMKTMPSLSPELNYAKNNFTKEDFRIFMNELRRLTTLMYDYVEYDISEQELYELVHQRNGSLPQN